MEPDSIKNLSIGALKEILFQNHVNATLILEKSDLVNKVFTLVEDERKDRDRKAMEEEQEKRYKEEELWKTVSQQKTGEKKDANGDFTESSILPPKAPATSERSLCVVCQDEEANIAIVDCGHLAMCRGCADLVLSSTRECPLCRTRIVTEQRLLRIYKS